MVFFVAHSIFVVAAAAAAVAAVGAVAAGDCALEFVAVMLAAIAPTPALAAIAIVMLMHFYFS